MVNIDMKIVILLAAAALLALGCPAPAPAPGAGSLSGIVRDSVTSAPVQGATVVVNPAGISWTADTRTIAFIQTSGATLNVVQLTDNIGNAGRILVNTPSGVCVLPPDFRTNVTGTGNGWDCEMIPVTSSRPLSNFIDLRIGGMGPMNVSNFQIAIVRPMTPGSDTVTDLVP
ncbi:MAG: hypothetical protein JXD23_11980 [Spirochaetales bacterium]|nr:hypothetical protein [Spirochaetales bacterium]